MCPHCGNEVVLYAEKKAQRCPCCEKWIAPCSLCDNCIKPCGIEQDCRRLNKSVIITKELHKEQWDILADLVLKEMTQLRDFGNLRGGTIKDLLTTEIGKMQTLYNYLIE